VFGEEAREANLACIRAGEYCFRVLHSPKNSFPPIASQIGMQISSTFCAASKLLVLAGLLFVDSTSAWGMFPCAFVQLSSSRARHMGEYGVHQRGPVPAHLLGRTAKTRLQCGAEYQGGGEYQVDSESLLPLDARGTPRQQELHRRRRERSVAELERLFEDRMASILPQMLEALNSSPGAMAVADNVLGFEHCTQMRSEAVAVAERGLLRGSASAYSTAPPETFEERYGDEPGISASVLASGSARELSPRCGAYIEAAARALSGVLSGARRGDLRPTEVVGGATDHQLRLTTVAQQVHMDNAFDGVNKR